MSSPDVLRRPPAERPTSWWLAALRKRKTRMYDERLDLSRPIEWSSEAEREAAIRFFNAAYRAEESGLAQAHALAKEVAADDPELAECLVLYGDEEGWHRELLTEFIAYLGGAIRPMGRVTRAFYDTYGRAERMDTIVLTNLMFETIGSTTYRLALRRARPHPAVRQMLTILTRDESFHVPLNVHFLRQILKRTERANLRDKTLDRLRLTGVYHLLYVTLIASSAASRRVAKPFDNISFKEMSTAYAEYLGRLFIHESDFALEPSPVLLKAFGLSRARLSDEAGFAAISVEAAEQAIDREQVRVTAL